MKIDFTDSKVNPLKMYGGANGNKIGIVYLGEEYMLKFPPKPSKNPDMSYANSCVCEHIACRIFEVLGMQSQQTLLGLYDDKLTVACKDFELDGYTLKDFAHLKNTIIDSEQNGYGTELDDILRTIREQQLLSSIELESFFWQMFIVDALLGNFDRHNGNWGFLINLNTGDVKIAPIFDCGSCLYPQLDEDRMKYILEHEEELDKRIYIFPTSAIKSDEKKINYSQFLTSTQNKGCLAALESVSKRIDLDKINDVINGTPYISDLQKEFFKTMIKARKEKIIDSALERNKHICKLNSQM